jgi:hypothetical protein
MSQGPYGPDEHDQAVCRQLRQDYPERGPGMCSLFGAYRTAGFERHIAAAMAVEACLDTPKEENNL